jgi:hypothetical protein
MTTTGKLMSIAAPAKALAIVVSVVPVHLCGDHLSSLWRSSVVFVAPISAKPFPTLLEPRLVRPEAAPDHDFQSVKT